MQGLHGQPHDVTFAYEGGVRAGEGARAADASLNGYGRDYQGRYSLRSDGAEFLDLYERGLTDDDRQSHSLLQNLGGTSSVTVIPDLKRLIAQPPPGKSKSSGRARPTTLSRTGCPDRILYLWYFQGLTDPTSMRYEFQGWEDVDGRRCLRVELDSQASGRPEDRDRFRIWIDMERGGHPLKLDQLREARVFARTRNVRLQPFQDTNGTSVWLPVSGQFETFIWLSKAEKRIVYYPDPVLVETYAVINGSVVLNRGLSDADLALGSNATKYGEFKDFKGFQNERPRSVRTDPKGVQNRLDESLADADSKAGRLEASAPERIFWNWSNVFSVGFPVLGVALLAFAGIWRWRAG